MTLEIRKFHLIEMIMAVRDEALMDKYEEILRKTRIEAYEATLKPMTIEAYQQELLEAEEDVKAGRMMSLEDLEKEMEKW